MRMPRAIAVLMESIPRMYYLLRINGEEEFHFGVQGRDSALAARRYAAGDCCCGRGCAGARARAAAPQPQRRAAHALWRTRGGGLGALDWGWRRARQRARMR